MNRVIINSSGTVTISGSVVCNTSITWTAGTLVATGSSISFAGTSINLQTGQVLNNLTMSFGGSPVVISNNLTLTGNLQLPNGVGAFNGPGIISVGGNLTNGGTSGGTCVIVMNGTGSITGTYGNAIEVNTTGIITVGTTCSVTTFTLTAGTLNLANELQLNSGTLTITAGITFTGSSNLRITANTASITSNSIPWPTPVIMAHVTNLPTTITITDNLTVAGSFTSSSVAASAVSLNGGPLNVNGDLTVTKTFGGSTNITVLGSSSTTWSGAGELGCNLNINKTGNFTVLSTVFFGNSKTLLYTNVGGVFTVAGSTLNVSSCTLSLGISVWNNLTIRASLNAGITHTVTLTSNTTFTGNFIANGTASSGPTAVNGLFNLNIGGSLSIGSLNGSLTGTATVVLNGTGTWSGGTTTAFYGIDITINSPSGAITATNIIVGNGKRTLCTSALTFTATGYLYINGSATLNAGSFVWNDLTIGIATLTLESSVTIRDLLTPSGLGGTTAAINGVGFTVNITRNLTHANTPTMSGTANLKMTGSGTWTCGAAGPVGIDLEFNSPAGSIVIGPTVVFSNSTKTLKYTNVGTFTTTGSTLTLNSGILDLQNIVWNNLVSPSSTLITLLSAANFNNVTFGTVSSGTSFIVNGLFNLNIRGNFTNNQTIGGISGTGTIRFTGTGNWGGSAGVITNPVIIDTAGAVTLTTNITWGLATRAFTVTAGTLNMGATTLTVISGTTITISATAVLNAGTSTLVVSGVSLTTFNTNSKNFFDMTVPANGNISINSLLSVTGILRLLGAATFTGVAGWTCANLVSSATGALFITLQEGITYTTTAGVSITGGVAAVGSRPTMRSSGPVNAIWTLNPGATQTMIYVNGTRIDSSGGQTIYSFGVAPADIATTINWYIGTRPGTVAYVFVF
jgi:hypothetical protein